MLLNRKGNLNRKGFTLVELLVTIGIISLVLVFSVFGIIKVINSSRDQKTVLSVQNLKEAALIYSVEASSDSWKKANEYDAFCVTVGELMNKGLLDKNGTISDKNISKNTYIIVKRNNVTMTIDKEEIVNVDDDNYRTCTNTSYTDNETISKPKINGSISYTDKIEISFLSGSASFNGTPSVVSYRCLFGESSSNVNREGSIEENKCILDNLKNNKDYYVRIYMNTNNESSVEAIGNINYKTADFNSPSISHDGNIATVAYNDKDTNGNSVINPSHYFKSTAQGTSDVSVEACQLTNGVFNCSGSTTNINSDTWYRVDDTTINISYPEENNTVTINARVYDGSDNYKEKTDNFSINKYVIRFYKNTALSIDGSTNEYIEKYCISAGSNSCKITSPVIAATTGYTGIGWNTTSNATSSTWNSGTEKDINKNDNYYAICSVNSYTITYKSNIVANGDFSLENTAWNLKSFGTVDTNVKYSNSNSVRIRTTSNGWDGITTLLGVTYKNNTKYKISLKAYRDSSSSYGDLTKDFRVYVPEYKSDGTVYSYNHYININSSNLPDKTWTSYSAEFTTSTSEAVRFGGVNLDYKNDSGTSNIWVSDIKLEEIQTQVKEYNATIGSFPTVSRNGYTFEGWFTEENGNGTRITTSSKVPATNSTYYAKWTPNIYKVTLDNQNATVAGTTEFYYQFNTYKIDNNVKNYYYNNSSLTTPLKNGYTITKPTKTGYTFGGYYTGTNGSGTQYVDASGNCINDLFQKNMTNITLYAKWTANTETINANKFVCETNRLAVYYVTTCSNGTCTYNKKNGLDNTYSFSLDTTGTPTWSINKSTYKDSLSDIGSNCTMSTYYVTASNGLNCRTGASTSNTTVNYTWSQCTPINVYRTTMKINSSSNWYYSSSYGCYLSGAYLSGSNPCSGSSDSGLTNSQKCERDCKNLNSSGVSCYTGGVCECCPDQNSSSCYSSSGQVATCFEWTY